MKFLILLTGFLLVGCKNIDPQLPPETQEGNGTFACKINDKVWMPSTDNWLQQSFSRPSLFAEYDNSYYAEGTVDIVAIRYFNDKKRNEGYESLHFGFQRAPQTGFFVYPWNKGTNAIQEVLPCYSIATQDITKTIDYCGRRTLTMASGFVIFTKSDYQKGIFSGRFEGILAHSKYDTVRITEGRFDLRF